MDYTLPERLDFLYNVVQSAQHPEAGSMHTFDRALDVLRTEVAPDLYAGLAAALGHHNAEPLFRHAWLCEEAEHEQHLTTLHGDYVCPMCPPVATICRGCSGEVESRAEYVNAPCATRSVIAHAMGVRP